MKRFFNIAPKASRRRNSHATVAALESLEDRIMKTAEIKLDGDTLEVKGTSASDRIEINYLDEAQTQIRVRFIKYNGKEILGQTFNAADIDEIEVRGLGGHDFIANNTGIDSDLRGGSGNDLLQGGTGRDRLRGNSGRDIEFDGDKRDIELDEGILLVTGTDSRDKIRVFKSGNKIKVQIRDANGNLRKQKSFDDDDVKLIVVNALNGNDLVDNDVNLRSVLNGGFGNDRLDGANARDLLNGGAGNDKLFGRAGNDALNGEDGNDYMNGSTGNDRMKGGLGNDRMLGGAGRDSLYGDSGDDNMNGGDGNDYLSGGDDNDRMHGDSDDDLMIGGSGNDRMYGDSGKDSIHGNDGNDYMSGASGNDRMVGGAGNDTIRGGSGNDFIHGDNEVDNGDGGNDAIFGGSGDDELVGGSGDDILLGESGLDRLFGMDGEDWLDGGFDGNRDILVGGADLDTMVDHIYTIRHMLVHEDWLADYKISEDTRINFRHYN